MLGIVALAFFFLDEVNFENLMYAYYRTINIFYNNIYTILHSREKPMETDDSTADNKEKEETKEPAKTEKDLVSC